MDGFEPDFTIELEAMRQGTRLICGIDEAGRGPWAGPVVAAAVIFSDYVPIEGLNDSKQVSASLRIILYEQIMAQCSVGIGQASAEEIDRMKHPEGDPDGVFHG